MRALIACESSGVVRDAFIRRGVDAWSCDLLASEVGGPHYQCDVRDVLGMGWDLLIAHPPCTFLSSSGLHWNRRRPGRSAQTEAAAAFAMELWRQEIPGVCIENPVGALSRYIGPPTQIIQPYQFGADASKRTCLWLRGLALLSPTEFVTPRVPNAAGVDMFGFLIGRPRWSNQTDSGQNKLPPSENRWRERSRTYPGIAEAMADAWSSPSPSMSIQQRQANDLVSLLLL